MIVDADARDGEIVWQPDPADLADTQQEQFAAFVRSRGVRLEPGYDALWRWSVDDADTFWSLFVDFAGVRLGGEPGPVRNNSPMPHTRWFPGRTVNFARHLLANHTGTAIIAVSEDGHRTDVTFDDLRARVGALSTHLRGVGVQPGDRVVAVLPNIPEAVIGLLAAASVGAVWSVCAPEFGPGAITSRFQQLNPKVVIAAPGYRLGGIDRDRSAELAEILHELDTVQEVIWVTGHVSVPAPDTATAAVRWEDVTGNAAVPEYTEVEFSHPLWVLFSSGTTGVPKGIVHGHGGALLEELQTLMFGGDLRENDRYFNVASTSWVVWNTLISALGVGAAAILLDGNPTHPSLDWVWHTTAVTGTTVLGVGAGFLHACAKTDQVPRDDHDLGALREIQVTGSPLSADGFRWVYRNVGDVWLVSMSGGTDIAGCFVGGAATEPVRVGFIQAPALGVNVQAWDDNGHPAVGAGELVVTEPMPSMPLHFWGDTDGQRYHDSYFDTYPGVWRHGDHIEFSANGIRILGRSDSTLNRNGIRLGSADIYSVVEALPEIQRSLVIGAEISDEDYYMPLFIHVSEGIDEQIAIAAVTTAIRQHLSVRYLPDEIVVVRGIPHTKTGKKLEVPVKRLIQGAALADVADPGAVDDHSLLQEFAHFAASRRHRTHIDTRRAEK